MFLTIQYFAIYDLIQIFNKIYLKSKETNWDNLKNEMLLRTVPSHKCISCDLRYYWIFKNVFIIMFTQVFENQEKPFSSLNHKHIIFTSDLRFLETQSYFPLLPLHIRLKQREEMVGVDQPTFC